MNSEPRLASAGWSKIKIGDEVSFSVTITAEMVSKFVEITGDDNLLHTDEAFAAGRGFPKKVAHGMLLASFFSRLVGKYFLGDDNLYLAQKVAFHKPIFIGDTVVVKGVIKNKIESAKIACLETTIKSPDGADAVTGEAQVRLGAF